MSRVIIYINNVISIIIYFLFRCVLHSKTKTNFSKSLLFINFAQIGDILISTVIFENIDLLYNYERIYFLINDKYLDLFKSYDGRIQIIGLNEYKSKYSLLYRIKILIKLRKEKFLFCFNLTPDSTLRTDLIALFSGAYKIYKFRSASNTMIKLFKNYIDKKYSKLIATNIVNEYEKNYEVLNFLIKRSTNFSFFNEKTFIIRKVNEISTKLPKIIIAPFSSILNKDWPIINYVKLIKKLQTDCYIIIIATQEQSTDLNRMVKQLNNHNLLIYDGSLKLNQLPDIIAASDLFIGGDSGMTHLALKLNKPFVAIIGGGSFKRFFPYKTSERFIYLYKKTDCFNCEWNCIYPEKFCITGVHHDLVYRKVAELLSLKGKYFYTS